MSNKEVVHKLTYQGSDSFRLKKKLLLMGADIDATSPIEAKSNLNFVEKQPSEPSAANLTNSNPTPSTPTETVTPTSCNSRSRANFDERKKRLLLGIEEDASKSNHSPLTLLSIPSPKDRPLSAGTPKSPTTKNDANSLLSIPKEKEREHPLSATGQAPSAKISSSTSSLILKPIITTVNAANNTSTPAVFLKPISPKKEITLSPTTISTDEKPSNSTSSSITLPKLRSKEILLSKLGGSGPMKIKKSPSPKRQKKRITADSMKDYDFDEEDFMANDNLGEESPGMAERKSLGNINKIHDDLSTTPQSRRNGLIGLSVLENGIALPEVSALTVVDPSPKDSTTPKNQISPAFNSPNFSSPDERSPTIPTIQVTEGITSPDAPRSFENSPASAALLGGSPSQKDADLDHYKQIAVGFRLKKFARSFVETHKESQSTNPPNTHGGSPVGLNVDTTHHKKRKKTLGNSPASPGNNEVSSKERCARKIREFLNQEIAEATAAMEAQIADSISVVDAKEYVHFLTFKFGETDDSYQKTDGLEFESRMKAIFETSETELPKKEANSFEVGSDKGPQSPFSPKHCFESFKRELQNVTYTLQDHLEDTSFAAKYTLVCGEEKDLKALQAVYDVQRKSRRIEDLVRIKDYLKRMIL